MGKYFDRFPLVEYNGVVAKNLLSKVDFTSKAKSDIYSNFDYTLKDGVIRPDYLSYAYYNNSYYDWVIYLSNNIIDPYYDYHMNDDDLTKFIIQKYGSLSEAQAKILFYRNNWAPDESILSVSVYDELDYSIQKYYKPIINNSNQVTGYERKREDWIISTNKICQLQLTSWDDSLIPGSIYEQIESGATAIINTIDKANLMISVMHIDGELQITDQVSSILYLTDNIPDAEASFWSKVTAYDYEIEVNESKKYINLIKNSYLPDIERMFKEHIK